MHIFDRTFLEFVTCVMHSENADTFKRSEHYAKMVEYIKTARSFGISVRDITPLSLSSSILEIVMPSIYARLDPSPSHIDDIDLILLYEGFDTFFRGCINVMQNLVLILPEHDDLVHMYEVLDHTYHKIVGWIEHDARIDELCEHVQSSCKIMY